MLLVMHDIGAELGPHERRTGPQRVVDPDDGGANLVPDVDELSGVDRRVPADRDHGRHRIADEPHLVSGECRVRWGVKPVGGDGHQIAEHRIKVFLREHGHHARRGASRGDIDAADAGRGMRAPHEAQLQAARYVHIRQELRLAGQHPSILDPTDPGAGESDRTHPATGSAIGSTTVNRNSVHDP